MRAFFYNLYKKLEIQEHRLLYLFFEITRRCNLDCLHCGSDCGKDDASRAMQNGAVMPGKTLRPELTYESWIKIARMVRESFGTAPFIVITGGEPLTVPWLAGLGREITAMGLRWGMVTNGVLLSPEKLAELRQSGLSSITISLDGPEAEHDRLRNRKGAFGLAVRALTAVAASGMELYDAVTCVYPANLSKLDDTARVLLDCGVKHWRLFRIFPHGRADDNAELLLTVEQTRRMLSWIADKRDYYGRMGLELSYSCEGYLPWKQDRAVRNEPFFCRAGVNIAAILSDGTITGCSNNAPRFYQGSILKDSFPLVWKNGFQQFRDRAWAGKGRCGKCADFKNCGGSSIHLWNDGDTEPAICYLGRLD